MMTRAELREAQDLLIELDDLAEVQEQMRSPPEVAPGDPELGHVHLHAHVGVFPVFKVRVSRTVMPLLVVILNDRLAQVRVRLDELGIDPAQEKGIDP